VPRGETHPSKPYIDYPLMGTARKGRRLASFIGRGNEGVEVQRNGSKEAHSSTHTRALKSDSEIEREGEGKKTPRRLHLKKISSKKEIIVGIFSGAIPRTYNQKSYETL